MIEGGLAPFETPFFFILIDPSKGSWRQLAAAGPSFLGLEALPCGPGGYCVPGSSCGHLLGAPPHAPAYFLA